MYRFEDIENIKTNMSYIQEAALTKYKTTYEPTLDESREIYKYILEFIKKKKRIIYGGYAINKLIKIKNENDAFYKEFETPDIEFYSYEPILDLIELCDYFKSKNLKYIMGEEGIHETTYKIYVNFVGYCDITYLAKNIYDRCLKYEHDGIIYAHPSFLFIDTFRVFCDPLTSYWRLDKSFNRYIKLLKYYPIKNQNNNIIIINQNDSNILKFIRKKIIHKSKYIVIGKYAYNYYIKKISENLINIDFYELISIDYKNDIINVFNLLKKHYNVTTKEYVPFYEFYDNKTEFYINNKLILVIYKNNKKCIVYRYSEKKKTYFGTFQLIYLYFLISYNYSIINNKNEITNYNVILYNLVEARNKYLDKYNKTVLDKTPFEEFTINCVGMPYDPIREARLNITLKKSKNKKIKQRYDPNNNKEKINNKLFENTSGNEIINKKNLTIK